MKRQRVSTTSQRKDWVGRGTQEGGEHMRWGEGSTGKSQPEKAPCRHKKARGKKRRRLKERADTYTPVCTWGRQSKLSIRSHRGVEEPEDQVQRGKHQIMGLNDRNVQIHRRTKNQWLFNRTALNRTGDITKKSESTLERKRGLP